MYTKENFGKDLKGRVLNKQDPILIGEWAYDVFAVYDYVDDEVGTFRKMLLKLCLMELGEGFTYSYDELNEIADDLIAGRPVNLD